MHFIQNYKGFAMYDFYNIICLLMKGIYNFSH